MSRQVDKHAELPVDPDAPELRQQIRPLHLRPVAVALVMLGGLVGTLIRYWTSLVLPTESGRWPWGTFIANVVGAFLLGALLEWLVRAGTDAGWRRRTRLLVGTGFCGGLTTYSTFAVEADLLVRSHATLTAVVYLVVTMLAGLVATIGGVAAATGHHQLRRRSANA